MPRPEGVHATYTTGSGPREVSIYKAEMDAHRARGTAAEYVFWPFGVSLEEAIKLSADAPVKAPRAPRAPRTVGMPPMPTVPAPVQPPKDTQ